MIRSEQIAILENESLVSKIKEINFSGYAHLSIQKYLIYVNFNPKNFLSFYKHNGRFSEKQIKFIERVYNHVKVAEDIDLEYESSGSKEELLELNKSIREKMCIPQINQNEKDYFGIKTTLGKVIGYMEKRELTNPTFFTAPRHAIPFTPDLLQEDYTVRLNTLVENYLSICKEKKISVKL